MKISLIELAPTLRGIYRDKMSGRDDFMPTRLRRLAPEVAEAFSRADQGGALVVSDMYRSPDGSLEAIRTRRGALRPSKSLHNYGLAIDVDVTQVMARLKLRDKAELDRYMAGFGFVCCRLDHKRDFEEWHYSYLPGFDFARGGSLSTDEGEAEIQRRYKADWDALAGNVAAEQLALQELRLYSGAIDGDAGPRTARARDAFCRAWELAGPADPLYYRTLALVTADLEIATT